MASGNRIGTHPLAKPLSEARIALISSGGVSSQGQTPFDAEDPMGDASIRVIHGRLEAWQVRHGHYGTLGVGVPGAVGPSACRRL